MRNRPVGMLTWGLGLAGLAWLSGWGCGGGSPLCEPGVVPDHPFTPVDDSVFPKGPYLMHTTEQSVVVMWESDSECDGQVEAGQDPDHLDLLFPEQQPARIHQIELTDLRPDTRYSYRVSSCGLDSAVHSLHTAPLPGAAVRFSVIGDTQGHPEISSPIIGQMIPEHPYFVLHVGDTVEDGTDESRWSNEFFAPFRPLMYSVPMYIAIGNHERNADAFYQYVSYPKPYPDPDWETDYSFSFGNVFVLVIDTNKLFFPIADVDTPISAWIKKMAASDEAKFATWRIAIGHEAGYSEAWSAGSCQSPSSFSGNGSVASWLLPLLAQHGFHAYFSGHTHDYERGEASGMLYFISGGGGGDLDTWCRHLPETQVQQSVHHHLLVDASCDTLTFSAISLDDPGTPFDQVVVQRTP